MTWIRPELLTLELVVLFLWALEERSEHLRRRSWRVLGKSGRPPGSGGRAWLATMAMLVAALAGPMWGRQPEDVLPPGHDVVFLIDVSRSMAATDAVPDRLGLATEAAERLVQTVGSEVGARVGVVAFAGRGVVRCPLTGYLSAAIEVIRQLRPGEVQPGGTDLRAGLETATALFGSEEEEPSGGRTIICLTDGEDLVGTWREAIEGLQRSGITVHGITVGDAENGHAIPVVGADGSRRELTYEGKPVRTRRDDRALAELTRSTSGTLIRLGLARPTGIAELYRDRIQPTVRARRTIERTPKRVERYNLLLMVALVISLVGSWPRRGTRILSLVVVLVGTIGAVWEPASESSSVSDWISRGNAAFAKGDFSAALGAFERAIETQPDSALPRFNAGTALFRLGRYAEASQRYGEARDRADERLRAQIDFALGNTAFARGDILAALKHYEDCLTCRLVGPEMLALRRDAAINRRHVERYRRVPLPKPYGNEEEPQVSPLRNEPGPSRATAEQPEQATEPESNRTQTSAETQPSAEERVESQSPEALLNRAIREAQNARRFRLPESYPPISDQPGRKDW